MKAQVVRQFGDATVFQLEDIPVPTILPGHVLIEVKATSVNPIDTKVRSGAVPAVSPDFPAILHGDVAGIVKEVGAGVTDFKTGDEVYGLAGGFKGMSGALAQYMLVDTRLISHKPKNLTFAEAAAIPLVTLTAWQALFQRANIREHDEILIHGAAGGVGHVAVQLAKWKGAKVYTTASNAEKIQIAKDFGADVVINYKEISVEKYVDTYTNGKGFSVIFDTVGGQNLDRSFEAAGKQGKVVTIAARSTHDLSPMHSKGLSFHVVFLLLDVLNESHRSELGKILKTITDIIENEELKPLIDSNTFTFDEVIDAHQHLESGEAVGKVVLVNQW
ncbi:zinc-dependent alcohol dehydrogenase family protein [Niallia sp. XMNu-256]|uniref:zinc-dependent alcohol dehydrogenase family protein n=1 Tax=Niallia sp. XMNu-256 TaxID=3082444 RepID=UPI0030D0D0F1